MQHSDDSAQDPLITSWDGKTLRSRIVKTLELVQDAIAISLCIGLFCVMVLQLKEIFQSLLTTLHFHDITADILFILVARGRMEASHGYLCFFNCSSPTISSSGLAATHI